jgi:hypothetical protein
MVSVPGFCFHFRHGFELPDDRGTPKALYLYIYLMDLEVLRLVGVNEATIQCVKVLQRE